MLVTGVTDLAKASKLMTVLLRYLDSSSNPDQSLIDISHVLMNQQHQALTDIATNILHELGECACVCVCDYHIR